jgi:hypothetical protein
MKSKRWLICFVWLLAGGGVFSSALLFSEAWKKSNRENYAREFSNSMADAVAEVMPSVVVIRTEKINYRIQRDFFGIAYRIP